MAEELHDPLPRDNAKTPEEAMKKIRNAQEEHVYVFCNGKQRLRFKGTGEKVVFDDRYLVFLKDSIIVHNHPNQNSFSREDVEVVIATNAKKLVVVTEDYNYIVERRGQSWPINFDVEETIQQFEESFALAENLVMKLISKNEITLFESEVEKMHYIWSSFFRMNDIKYAREKYQKG